MKAAEASLARRGGLHLTLPAQGSDAASFKLPGGTIVTVRERGLTGPARVEGGAVVYPRADGSSYWSVTGDGFEEWIEVANAGAGPVAEWDVTGATLRQAGEAVELLDAQGTARARVKAPLAYEAGGAEKRAWLRAVGGRLALFTDARGAAIVDPVWTTLRTMVTGRSMHTATLLPSGKVLVAGGYGNTAGALAAAELFDPSTGNWVATGSLATGRYLHTATLLRSGDVLVVGGADASSANLASAETYRTATGTWTTIGAGTLTTARRSHTATLLETGKVLVVGGVGPAAMELSSAELLDPAAGVWSSAGGLSGARFLHTATLLPTGHVLVAGGHASTGALRSTELYDAAAGTWSVTGEMANGRSSHTATLLPSGLVLVVGGRDVGAIGSVELYDPGLGTWSSGNALTSARYYHTATLLPSGKVLVTNGHNGTNPMGSGEIYDPGTGSWAWQNSSTARSSPTATLLPSGQVLVTGGEGIAYFFDTAEFFDTTTGGWSGTGAMGTARYSHTTTLLASGKVLVAGGSSGTGSLADVEIYEAASGTWSTTGSLAMSRQHHTATLLSSGKVLVAGGQSVSVTTTVLASAELYDPATGTWTISGAGTLATPRDHHSATLLPSGKVLVVGGLSGTPAVASAELYDPATGTWSTGGAGTLTVARASHTATLLPSGKVLVAGGFAPSGYPASAEVYDPATGAWNSAEGGVLGTARYSHTATLLSSGKVLVAGGFGPSGYLASAELYDPASASWSATGPLTTGRYAHASALLPSGRVLVVGGTGATSWLASAEIYDPATGNWSASGSLAVARENHTATPLASGKVLVVGGDNTTGYLADSELFDEGRGAQPGWTPAITTSTAAVTAPGALSLTGTLFTGVSEASSGGSQSSAGNFPLVQLQSADGGAQAWAALSAFSATTATASVPASFPPGPAWLRVVSNGVPSEAKLITILSPLVLSPASVNLAPRESQLFTATGGSGIDYVWSFDVNPSGASFTSGSTYAAGTTGSVTDVIRVTDSLGNWATASIFVTAGVSVSPATVLVVPGETVGFDAVGGKNTGFYTWAFGPGGSGGTLGPPGQHVDYTAGSTTDVTDTIYAIDSLGNSGSATVQVRPAVTITTTPLTVAPRATLQLAAAGGSGTGWSWSIAGVPPPGGGIDASTGLFSAGTAPSASYTVWAMDSLGHSGSAVVQVTAGATISPATTGAPPKGTIDFDPSGGSGTGFAWSLTSFPSGGSIDASTGVYIAGPMGGVTDVVQLVDSLGNTATRNVAVSASLAVTPSTSTAPPRGPIDFDPVGGSGTGYVWSLTSSPSGGSIDASTGAYVAGATGGVTDVVQLVDSLGNVATRDVTVTAVITVVPSPATLPPRGTQGFTPTGGSGTGYVWSFVTNGSGGSLTAGGAYTAGSTGSVSDVLRVVDSLSNVAQVTVAVTAGVSVNPPSASIQRGNTITFSASGGSGAPYTWSFTPGMNRSGGSITAGGFYTSGNTGGVTDEVRVTDTLGNVAAAQIDVAAAPGEEEGVKSAYGCSSAGGSGGSLLLFGLAALLLARTRRRAGAALLALAVALPLAAAAAPKEQKTRVAVMPIKGGLGIEPKLAEIVTDALVAELTDRGLQIITSKDVESALGFERQKQMLGCGDQSCLAEIAGALGADRVVSGDIAQVRELTIFSVQVFNTRNGTVEKRFHERMSGGDAADLLDATERAGAELFPGTSKAGTATRRKSVLTSTARPLALVARGGYDVKDPGGFGMVGLEYRVSRSVRLGLGALGTGAQSLGAAVRVGWYPLVFERLSLFAAAEAQLLFPSELLVAANVALGAEWAFSQRFAMSVEVPLTLMASAPAEYRTTYFMPGLSASWRF